MISHQFEDFKVQSYNAALWNKKEIDAELFKSCQQNFPFSSLCSMIPQCLKIAWKVAFSFASEASYVYILLYFVNFCYLFDIVMFCYVLLSFVTFCYVLLCWSRRFKVQKKRTFTYTFQSLTALKRRSEFWKIWRIAQCLKITRKVAFNFPLIFVVFQKWPIW